MSNCEQKNNKDFPKPDLANAVKPEKNMPERISQKDGLDYVAPQERNTKKYRPLGSFAQKSGKDEAEPELPHDRIFKTPPNLENMLDSEAKISVTVDSSTNRPNKIDDELNINDNNIYKNETNISQNQQSVSKLDNNININSAPSIKIGDTIFVNSTRQYKNSSIDITGERKSKEDASVPDNNTHTKKNPDIAEVDSDNRFIKTSSNIPTYGPEKNAKTSEKEIDANIAFMSPKSYEDLNIYPYPKSKRDKNIIIEETNKNKSELKIKDVTQSSKGLKEITEPKNGKNKSELKIKDTIQSSKGLKEIDDPENKEEKYSTNIEDTKQSSKGLKEIDDPFDGEEKSELKIEDTIQLSKGLKEIDDPSDGEEKSEYVIDGTVQLSKGLKEIDDPSDGEEKSELKIEDTIQLSKDLKEIDNPENKEKKDLIDIEENTRLNEKNLQEIDEIIQQNEKDLLEIESNNILSEKELHNIDDIITVDQKGLEEIIYDNNRTSKPNINEIETETDSSINKESITIESSELLQKTNLLYNINTPEHQIIENNYDVNRTLRNKDIADNIPATNSTSAMFNKNLSNDINSSKRKIKDSTNNITTESFSGFGLSTDEEIIAAISNNNKTKYNLDVLNEEFTSNNNYNLNFNYYDDDFNSIVSSTNFNAEVSINAGKLISSTPRKISTNAISSIGATSPLDQEDDRWDYQTIIENNSGEKAKASGEAITANSYASINTSSHNLINQEIYSNNIINIDSSSIQVNNNIANIKNKNFNYNSYSSPRDINIDYMQQGYDLTTPRKTAVGGERILNTQGVISQSQVRADYTTPDIITGVRTNLKSETNFHTINAVGFDSTLDTITIADISLDRHITNIPQQITSRIDYTHFSARTEDIKLDSNTGLPINWTSYESEFAIYNDIEDDDIIDRLVVTSVIGHLAAQPIGQENHNFTYNIASFVNRSTPDDIIYGNNPSTVTIETTHTRQALGGISLKATTNSSIVNTVDDTFWSEAKIGEDGEPERDADGNIIMISRSSYNGEARQILDDDNNIIGYSYYNQENKNFNYTFDSTINSKLDGDTELPIDWASYESGIAIYNDIEDDDIIDRLVVTSVKGLSARPAGQENYNFTYDPESKEGVVASKNSIASNYSPISIFLGNKEFGINDYKFPEGNFFIPSSPDYVSGVSSSAGLSASRDIETAGNEFNPWWQMLLNVGSITGVNSAINNVSGIISNVGQLLNENFYKQFIGTSFSLNNDFGNIMRRFATVDIPVVAGSFLRSHSMMGGQDPLVNALDAVDGIKDLVSTTTAAMNQPAAFLANLLRGESGILDVFTGGGSNMINIAAQGTDGKFGGLFLNNVNASNDILDSFAVRGSQWKTTPGQTIWNRATTKLGQPYNKDFIVDQIKVDGLKRKELAKETLLTEYAAYKAFISGYEGIRELANEDVSSSTEGYPTSKEVWDINNPRTQSIRQKSATAKPMTGGTITPYELWKKDNVKSYLHKKEVKDDMASEPLVLNPESLIHNKPSEGTFYDHIVVSSNSQTSLSGDAEWRLHTTDKNDDIWKQISSIPHANLKYNSDIIFQAENRVRQEFHSIGVENKLNPEQIRIMDPHDIEIRFNSSTPLEEQTNTKSMFLSINNNNYGGGKRAFIERNKDKMLILLDETPFQPIDQSTSRNNASTQSIA